MKRVLNLMRCRNHILVVVALLTALSPGAAAFAQGVTTGALNGIVTNERQEPIPGATVIAIHLPSGTNYESVTRADGRFTIPGMRVGGPYSVTVTYTGTGTAFEPQTQENVQVTLGIGTDLTFQVRAIAVQETVTVSATVDPVFSSSRTGAATAVNRADIATLPTLTGRIGDITRLTPQASGSSFAGQDNRLNNMTVDGSYFNNSFGLGSAPGERTNVAPISLESIEQVQVSVAPFDVRQGNFIGAAVNTVTRSGTNQLNASFYHRMRSDDFVGTEARGQTVSTGTFTFRNTGVWAGVPIVKNRLFVFGNYENEEDKRPLTTFRANNGGEPVGGAVTRVRASDLTALSSYLSQNFQYNTGSFAVEDMQDLTPAKRYLLRTDFNLTNNNKISFRYNQLDSSSGNNVSGSSSAGIGRPVNGPNFISYTGSTYQLLENIKSGIGEWNSVIGSSMSNNLIVGYTTNDESRGDIGGLFPFVDILQDGSGYTSFGSEPFSVQNQLRYQTFQLQNSFMKFSSRHTLTFGFTTQKYHADNVFWSCCPQSNYTFNSLADFYTEANAYLANPNRTAATPNALRGFKVRYSNVPGLDQPLQQLDVWNSGGYFQDEWRPRRDLTVTAGLRLDAAMFANTAYRNEKADALTFRDENGSPVQYQTGELPDTKILWSPRVAMNWDLGGQQRTQLRAGTGTFTGPPLYVWISNQLGNTGVLIGEISCFVPACDPSVYPFNPDPNRYKPTNVTGQGAASYELNVTDRDFTFPQVWRTNLAVDHRLPGGMTGTLEYLYNRDVNGIYYINANLPAAQSAFVGADNRPRWVGPGCGAPTAGPCQTRLNNAAGNQVTSASVMKNQDIGRSWNLSGSLAKTLYHGLSMRGAYSYGVARNTIDPGSTAFSSIANNQIVADPNNPGLGYSAYSQGHRVFVQASYTKSYFNLGATTISTFWEARPAVQNFTTRVSYVFAGDMNGDGFAGNDLIYIPRDASEMNFVQFTHSNGRVFTAAEQATAFEAFIQQDEYLRTHRGQYAERNGGDMPIFKRMDLSVVQDIFQNIGGKRNAGQIRLDITNFGNLLNSDWGVSQRLVAATTSANGAQVLTNAAADAQGRASYRMAVVNNELIRNTFTSSTSVSGTNSDVYQLMLSFRYSFN